MKYLFIGMIALLSFSCNSQNAEGAKDVNVKEFAEGIEKENVIILDVRTPGEVAEGKIEGAIVIDFMAGGFEDQIKELDKSKAVYIYCRSGGRSKKAQNIMADNGFKTTYNLLGGMSAWEAEKMPIVK